MAYTNHFQHADEVILHLDTIVPTIPDPMLKVKYVGFVAVCAVTVYELAIKEILINFGTKKHRVLGAFTESFFARINGRIKLNDLKTDYTVRFGEKYKNRFHSKINERSRSFLVTHRRDFVTAYGNIITWRHEFAHEGRIHINATYQDAVQAYRDGKEVVHCLAETMVR